MLPAFLLEQPSITLLHHIVAICQQGIADFKGILQKQAFFCGNNERYGRGTFEPAVFAFSPTLHFANGLGIFLDEVADGVVAEPVAFSPVVDVTFNPTLERRLNHLVQGDQCSLGARTTQ